MDKGRDVNRFLCEWRAVFVRQLDLPPDSLALALSSLSPTNELAWLDSADGEGVSILAFDPVETRSFGQKDGTAFLEFLKGTPSPRPPPKKGEGALWLSYISYEAFQFNPLIPFKPVYQKDYPLAVFKKYDTYVWIDHEKNETRFVSSSKNAEKQWGVLSLSTVDRRPLTEGNKASVNSQRSTVNVPQSTTSRTTYDHTIASIKEHLLAGDYYELNYTIEFRGRVDGRSTKSCAPTLDLYLRLRDIARAPMMAFFDWSEIKILSASPERFFRIEGGAIKTHPIKGTIKRGATPDEDEKNKEALLSSEKDRAELLMVTDMLRNDLGRVCEIGSVKTDPVFGLHTFSHYHHLISDLSGQLKKDRTLADVFCALFPGGSITGAPKIAAMKDIDRLENRARGIYTGAVGYFTESGIVDFNIPIRTIVIEEDLLSFAVGGGIVADSAASAEYEECLVKAGGLFRALGG